MALLTGTNNTRVSQYTADQLVGTGAQTSFTLSRNPPTPASVTVSIDGVKQHSNTYSVSSNQLIFTEAPPNGSAIEVVHNGSQGIAYVPSDSSVTTQKLVNGAVTKEKLDVSTDGTGAMQTPVGTTVQRPLTPSIGLQRTNSVTGLPEFYNGTTWVTYQTGGLGKTPTVDYLVVAGGGGSGGGNVPGAGGGGGVATDVNFPVSSGATLTVTVGAGGAPYSNGSNSVFSSITAYGGGVGGSESSNSAGTGGSGGGGSYAQPGGRGTPGQGCHGGFGATSSGGTHPSGGGGGAGGPGGQVWAGAAIAGFGGPGLASDISGSVKFYGGGGGGSLWQGGATNTPGGAGGGGQGGYYAVDNATNGTPNTGGGAGGPYTAGVGKSGGSGIVIIRYPATYDAPTSVVNASATIVNGYRVYTWLTSGSITF